MSELGQRLKSLATPEERVVVQGIEFWIRGLKRSERSQLLTDGRKKNGELDSRKTEGMMLSACVFDTQGHPVLENWQDWDDVPAAVTGPLVNALMKLNGLDNEDLRKNSDTTDS